MVIIIEYEFFGIVIDRNALDLFKAEFIKIMVDLLLVWLRAGSKKKDENSDDESY